MFKKHVTETNASPLSGKDVKTLKKDIQTVYRLSDDQLKRLFPSKADITVQKLSNKTKAYACTGENPLFFDPDGRGNVLLPTVYALWQCPELLPKVHTYSEVSPKVLGGADLFLQGFIVSDESPGDFNAGDVRVVAVPGNQFPFALGTMETSSEAAATSGMKGKGLKLLHHYPDLLWALGDKTTPDASFTPMRIFPQAAQNEAVNGTKPAVAASGDESAPVSQPAAAATPPSADGAEEASSAEPAASGPSQVDEDGPMSMDQIVEHCLEVGLLAVPEGELPIMTSDFYTKYMLPCLPAGANVDIKKSTYKKLSKLLTKYEKKGMLTQKLIRKQEYLATVDRSHAGLSDAAAAQAANSKAAAAAEVEGADAGQPSAGGAAASGPVPRMDVTFLFRVPTSLKPIFGDAWTKEQLFSEAEVAKHLRRYVKDEGLAEGMSEIKLDELLVGNLYNKKEPQQAGNLDDFDEVQRRLQGKLQQFHRVLRQSPQGPVEVVRKGTPKHISIQMEDRQGGRKHITRVAHVESFAIDADDLATMLQRKLQTNASVTKLPGKTETDKEIALQGSVMNDVAKFLLDNYGIDGAFVDIKNRSKG